MSAPAASEASPSQIAGGEFAGRDPRRQVRHRYLDDEIDHDLNDQRDRAPDQAIHHIGGMGDGADHRQHETEQAQAQRDRGRRVVVADQLEFVVRGDAGVDEEIGDDGDDRRYRNRPGTPAVRPVIEGSFRAPPSRPTSRSHDPSVGARQQPVRSPKTKTPPFAAGFSLGGVSLYRLPGKLSIRRESALRPRAARAARSRGPRRSR